MNQLHYLLVEGKDDFHVVKNLLAKHTILSDEIKKWQPNRRQPGVIYIDGFGDGDNYAGRGIEELKKTFKNHLETDFTVSTIGIVVDADNDVLARWEALSNLAKSIGDCEFHTRPPQAGHITTIKRQTKPPVRLGIWIMPNNGNEGMLEHFVSDLIPTGDFLWHKAQADVIAIPEAYRLFSAAHIRKAEIHTWLAWQKIPGRPMGIGVTAGWFDHQSPLANLFIGWIRNLFEI